MLENGSNAKTRDSRGEAVLWVACLNGRNAEVVRLLLQHGATVATVTDNNYWSGEPLLRELACSLELDGKSNEVELEHGASPLIRDSSGKLPLDGKWMQGTKRPEI